MDRNEFIRKSFLGTGVLLSGAALRLNAAQKSAPATESADHNLGFNHLPPKKSIEMPNMIIHKASTRGHADHGWLKTYHSFSFSSYYNPERMQFGALRVLNDDTVEAGMGFGTHPHNNMEIISIPLEGDLEHKDSMGNTAVIRNGDIQVMSAGTGVEHSEYNRNPDKRVKFLQIWLFPNKQNVKPRYDQISLPKNRAKNNFYQIVSPNPEDAGTWIHQDAWFHLGAFEAGKTEQYKVRKKDNGVYVFLLKGKAKVNSQEIERRDGMGLWNTGELNIEFLEESEVLLMDVPMQS